jgi:glycosyltransferase involved in cell wall biosynthesis
MRLVVICSHYPPLQSPESVHAMMLCEQMAEAGLDVHLLTGVLPPSVPPARGFCLHPIMSGWGWSCVRELTRACKRIEPDVILLMYIGWIYGDHPMITFAPTFLHRAIPRIRVITQFENTLGAKVKSWRSSVAWKIAAALARGRPLETTYGSLLSDSDGVIVLSDRHLDALAASCPSVRAKSTVIAAPPLLRMRLDPQGDARREARLAFGLDASDEETVVFGYFGYIYPTKGVDTLLRAFGILRSRMEGPGGVRVKLVLLGKVNPEMADDLFVLARKSGILGDVIWTGYCGEEHTASTCLRGFDAAVLPFDNGVLLNNSSFVVCAAHGLPIVTTRPPQAEGGLDEGQTLLLCPPKDPEALAHAMESVARDGSLRRRMGLAAQNLADRELSWTRVRQRTLDVLKGT